MQRSSDAGTDPDVDEPHVDGDGASNRDTEIGGVVEGFELDEHVQSNVQPRRHWAHVKPEVQRPTTHNALGSYRKVGQAGDVDHAEQAE